METYFDAKINDFVCRASTPAWIVKNVVPCSDYSLQLQFEDGKTGVYDARPLLEKKIYEPLNNLSFFMMAHVEGDTVVWMKMLILRRSISMSIAG